MEDGISRVWTKELGVELRNAEVFRGQALEISTRVGPSRKISSTTNTIFFYRNGLWSLDQSVRTEPGAKSLQALVGR